MDVSALILNPSAYRMPALTLLAKDLHSLALKYHLTQQQLLLMLIPV